MRTNFVLADFENVQPKDLHNNRGHPLAGRSQARTPYQPAILMAGFLFASTCLVVLVEPVSSLLAATESRLPPIWIKRLR
jgi:hypothetical protein